MGRKICVPHTPSFHLSAQNKLTCTEEVDQNPASHKGTVMHDDLLYNIKCHVQSIEKMTDDSYIQARIQDFNVGGGRFRPKVGPFFPHAPPIFFKYKTPIFHNSSLLKHNFFSAEFFSPPPLW